MGITKICPWKSGDNSCQVHIPGSLEDEGKGKEDNPVYGADSGKDLDDCDLEGINCELCMVEGKICSIPYELFDLPDLREILSLETWNSCLTEEDRFCLSAYLPDMDEWTFWLTMKELFGGSDLYFGNPMDAFFKRVKGGFYPPKVCCLRESLQFLERRKYYYTLRSYHDKMAQMFTDMRRLWDECNVSTGVQERLYMWRTRGSCRDSNLLDLNAVPSDGYLLNEDANSDSVTCHLPRRMKTWETVSTKNIVASPSADGMTIIAPNYSTKGVLKVNTSGSNAIHNHNQKLVVGDKSEQCLSVPKGLLKAVTKVPSVLPSLSKVCSRRSQTALLVGAGAQVLRDPKPERTILGNAGGFSGSSFLWQNIVGSKMNPERSGCMLNHQDCTFRSKEVDFADSKRHKLGGENLWKNFAMGKRHKGNGDRMQKKFMAFPNQIKTPSDFNVENSEKTNKPSVSKRLKYDLPLPLTYKRRKPQARNTSDLTNSLRTGIDIRTSSSKESNQPLGNSVNAFKFKFLGPMNGES
ncbi:hypothetical protein ES288_A07G154900v1 [Gossypium darwinii]|uniref:DEUBAD domain-containing protein n=1 Tax=Gossypium darwinii TaxID=34276 RepID=A0A5D2FVR5_GOSDA|nr:hypothetical protein ES288_A07G154900v1 [Gossypium darwinii]